MTVDRRLRVLAVTTTFPRFDGDAVPARFVHDLCCELSRNCDVTVLAPHDPGAAFDERMGPLRVVRFPYWYPLSAQRLCDGVGILPNFRASALAKLQAPALFAAQLRALKRLLRDEPFDVVHSHWLIPSGFDVARALGRGNTAHVLTIHSSDIHLLRRLSFGPAVTRATLRRTDRVFVVSTHLKKILDGLAGETVDAEVLPMGFDPATFAPLGDAEAGVQPGRVLFVGKLIPVKGVEHLIRAFPLLRERRPDAELVIVGGGPLLEPLRRLAAEQPGGEAIRFTGPLPHDQVRREYERADIVVAPSIVSPGGETEGLPVVILEALAMGVPVVVSRVGSLDDVIDHGRNGLLAPPADPQALAEAMATLLAREDRSRWTRDCAESVRRFTWPAIAARYRDAFEIATERRLNGAASAPRNPR